MRHQVAGHKLGRPTSHRWALYRNQVTELLKHGKIVTTQAKAKGVQSLVEKMITLGKEGGLASRRQVLAFVTDKKAVERLFNEISPKYVNRSGGYIRQIKLGQRLGDNAPMVQLELVE